MAGLSLQPHPRLHPPQIEKVAHQTVHLLEALQDPLNVLALAVVEIPDHGEHGRVSPHRGQRGAEIV